MAYEQKPNTGTIFKNDRRDKDSQPNMKGKALIGGVWYWVSAWTNEPRGGGDKYQSLSFEEMTNEQVAQYTGGASEAPRQQQQRPAPGRQSFLQQNGRGQGQPRSAPRQAPPRQEAPFIDEKHFAEADIPF